MYMSNPKNGIVISSFYSDDHKRKADIIKDHDGFLVRMYDNGILEETRSITNHAINYVEDLAENFVEGIGYFSVDTFNKLR